MSSVFRPVNQPPKLEEYRALSVEAQTTLAALEKKYARLLSQLHPPTLPQCDPSEYYKSIYKSTFKKTPPAQSSFTWNEDGNNGSGNVASQHGARSSGNTSSFYSPTNTSLSTYKDAPCFSTPSQNLNRRRQNSFWKEKRDRVNSLTEIIMTHRPSDKEIEESVLSLTQRTSAPDSPCMELDVEEMSPQTAVFFSGSCKYQKRNSSMETISFPPLAATQVSSTVPESQENSSLHTFSGEQNSGEAACSKFYLTRKHGAKEGFASKHEFPLCERRADDIMVMNSPPLFQSLTQENDSELISGIWSSGGRKITHSINKILNEETLARATSQDREDNDIANNERESTNFELNLSGFECSQNALSSWLKQKHSSASKIHNPDMTALQKEYSQLDDKDNKETLEEITSASLHTETENPLDPTESQAESQISVQNGASQICRDLTGNSSGLDIVGNKACVSESPFLDENEKTVLIKESHKETLGCRKRKKFSDSIQQPADCSGKALRKGPLVPRQEESGTDTTKANSKKLKSSFKPPSRVLPSLNADNATLATQGSEEECENSSKMSLDSSSTELQITDVSTLSPEKQRGALTLLESIQSLTITLLYDTDTTSGNTFYTAADFAKKQKKNSAAQPQVTGTIILTEEQQPQCFLIPLSMMSTTAVRDSILNILSSKKTIKVISNCKEFLKAVHKLCSVDYKHGIKCESVQDPVIACWLVCPDIQPSSFTQMCQVVHLPYDSLYGQLVLDLPQNEDDWRPCLQFTPQLMQAARAKLRTMGLWTLFTEIEMKLVPILASMETCTIKIDMKTFIHYSDILKKKLHKLEETAHKLAGRPFMLSSHTQVRQILYDELKLDQKLPSNTKLGKTDATSLISTCESSLNMLAEVHPLPALILEYRQLHKLKSTYVDGLMSFVTSGTLSTHWDQTAAASGRLTSSQPNVQAIPKTSITITDYEDNYVIGSEKTSSADIHARQPFISNPGHVFLAADFKQIELRLMAHLSEDSYLLSHFWRPEAEDAFISFTSQWHKKPAESVTTEERERTKRVVYAVLYGAGHAALSQILKVTPDVARDIVNSFQLQFPAINNFTKKCWAYAREYGYLETVCGRRRYFPNINSSSPRLRAQDERKAINFCVQGSAADVCKLAMLAVEDRLQQHAHLTCRLLLQIHDELVWEVPEEQLAETKGLIQQTMEDSTAFCGKFCMLQVPLTIGLSSGKSWAHLAPSVMAHVQPALSSPPYPLYNSTTVELI